MKILFARVGNKKEYQGFTLPILTLEKNQLKELITSMM